MGTRTSNCDNCINKTKPVWGTPCEECKFLPEGGGIENFYSPLQLPMIEVKELPTLEDLEAMFEEQDKPQPLTALDTQVGGGHYKSFAIQPIEFVFKNNLNFLQGNIIKYACRYKDKNGREDLEKVIHYAQLLIELEYGNEARH